MDPEIVARAAGGEREAFAALAGASIDRCYAIAYRILRDPEAARDAVQSAMLAAWRDLPALREADRFEAWLHRILVRCCYEEARRSRAWPVEIRSLPVDRGGERDAGLAVVERDRLERAFRRLTPEQRAVVVLHHHVGLPLTEIASTLGIPAGTARSRLHHATRRLRSAIDADDRLEPAAAEVIA